MDLTLSKQNVINSQTFDGGKSRVPYLQAPYGAFSHSMAYMRTSRTELFPQRLTELYTP